MSLSQTPRKRRRRVKLTVAYDGTDFRGWAAQTGQRTVQGTLKEAIRRVSGEDAQLDGASRTDSGAHAEGQVCHFDTEVEQTEMWLRALNDILPRDLRVLRSQDVPDEFNSRFCARDRFYRYRILCGTIDPFRTRFVSETHRELDLNAMQQAAKFLVGKHDYRAYTEELDPSVENTVRDMRSVSVSQHRDEIWIDIVGTAFLRGMMRRMAGALFEVGKGQRPIHEVGDLLTAKRKHTKLPVVLPAKGLCLKKIRYGRHPRDNRKNASFDE
ncbi:MAG: tRNA pseudouridine(38-40) synthase TruA [Armatimonadetes bacterium]|nr:tRNA pseudouridine(38-40) synthase TruA [Armatimonadota bacterium]